MFILSTIFMFLLGYAIGFFQEHSKRNKKERECLNKKQMIENRDKLIEGQQSKIKKLKENQKTYEQIKEIYKTERKIVDRDDKVKELIANDN